MKNTKAALKWITEILNDNAIPFQITGGFAARLYGSNRPLYDIDLEISDNDFEKLTPFVKGYLFYGPDRSKDETFDILLMTLEYKGQLIDISGANTDMLYNKEAKRWESCNTDITQAVEMEVYNLRVPVATWQSLLEYKKRAARPTDLEDVKNIERMMSNK